MIFPALEAESADSSSLGEHFPCSGATLPYFVAPARHPWHAPAARGTRFDEPSRPRVLAGFPPKTVLPSQRRLNSRNIDFHTPVEGATLLRLRLLRDERSGPWFDTPLTSRGARPGGSQFAPRKPPGRARRITAKKRQGRRMYAEYPGDHDSSKVAWNARTLHCLS